MNSPHSRRRVRRDGELEAIAFPGDGDPRAGAGGGRRRAIVPLINGRNGSNLRDGASTYRSHVSDFLSDASFVVEVNLTGQPPMGPVQRSLAGERDYFPVSQEATRAAKRSSAAEWSAQRSRHQRAVPVGVVQGDGENPNGQGLARPVG